ncbi:uncharacterized protein LOC119651473 [Hermetia illucens]|uniref:uncharacterized protein LOC119651473 n=1 Tax=Hermetia illucens TaxID=343691 RepID=UPI0018CC3D95|nr:uncharacterized protein LOC119651473 [Hermetia illucens]XP_037911011.1 uncharacterized protein LOC119651473 [Hermetia illucens]
MFRQLNEIHNLDFAIQNCKELAKCLEGSINYVRRLNLKYNTCSWMAEDYQDYLNEIMQDTKLEKVQKRHTFHGSSNWSRLSMGEPAVVVTPRRNHSLIGVATIKPGSCSSSPSVRLHRNVRDIIRSNSDMNLKLIKIKRNVESLLHNVEHTIKVSNKKNAYLVKQRCRLRLDKNLERRRCWCCH